MGIHEKLMTVEAFWEAYAGKPYELIDGEVVEIVPTGFKHGRTIRRMSKLLGQFVDDHDLGEVVVGELGVQLGPNILRAADIAFISHARLAQISEPEKYVPFAPDLVVEVVSPSNTADEIQLKVSQYLKAGVLLIWMMYSERKRLVVYDSQGRVETLSENDMLDGGEVLPGLMIPVAELFPPKMTKDK